MRIILLMACTLLVSVPAFSISESPGGDTLAKFNFCYDASFEVPDWTTVYGTDSSPIEADNDIMLIIDGGYLTLGSSGSPFSTAVPDLVSNTYNWMSNENETPVQLIISGLDPSQRYDFHIYASRDSASASGDRTTTYTIVGSSISGSINPVGNTSEFVDLSDVTPASTGTVIIELTKLEGQYGYINAMIICKKKPTGLREDHRSGEISIYPNPAGDFLRIDHLPELSRVSAFDVTGRAVLHSIPEGQNLLLDVSNWHSGIYMIRIENDGKPVKCYKVLKN